MVSYRPSLEGTSKGERGKKLLFEISLCCYDCCFFFARFTDPTGHHFMTCAGSTLKTT